MKSRYAPTWLLLLLLSGVFLFMQPLDSQGKQPSPAPQADPAITDLELFRQANTHFNQANEVAPQDPAAARDLYEKALLRYERLVRQGVNNGKLYYNIGNTHFRLNDIGRAIINYRRAELLMPHDANLAQNLAYVMSKRQDRIEPRQEEQILKILFFFHYDLSTSTRIIMFGVGNVLFWLGCGFKLFRGKAGGNGLLAIPLILTLTLLSSLLIDRIKPPPTPGVLTAAETIARKGDGMTYKPSFAAPLHAGTEFRLREQRGNWLYITLADGSNCWIPADNAELVNPQK